MKPRRKTSPLLLLVVFAALGCLFLFLPGWFIDQYERASQLGRPWATVYLAVVGIGGALLLTCSLWILWRLWRNTRARNVRKQERDSSPSKLSPTQQAREIRENLEAVQQLSTDSACPDELRGQLAPLARRLEEKSESQSLEIVAFGTVSSGKSSLLNSLAGRKVFATDVKGGTTVQRNEVPWPGVDKVTLVDTPGVAEADGHERQAASAATAKDADLVLVVVDGPLRDSEFGLLGQLGEMEKRMLICLNKEDLFDGREKAALMRQIAGQVKDLVHQEDVVAVRARPSKRTRVRVLADAKEVEEQIEIAPDIAPLAERMMGVVRRDGRDLLLANLLLQSRGLVDEARRRVQDSLDRRAWEIVQRYMWGAAGAAAMSPFPIVDLVAGCAVSTKMVLDLARVYRQDVDLEVAVSLLGQLGKNLLAILGVSAATPVVAAAVASLLKTVPGAGTIAGGLLQGIVLALVTRWIGAVFIEYFKNQMHEPAGGLADLARKQWERLTTAAELRRLVQAARSRSEEDDRP